VTPFNPGEAITAEEAPRTDIHDDLVVAEFPPTTTTATSLTAPVELPTQRGQNAVGRRW
jgi:hypothetical protein